MDSAHTRAVLRVMFDEITRVLIACLSARLPRTRSRRHDGLPAGASGSAKTCIDCMRRSRAHACTPRIPAGRRVPRPAGLDAQVPAIEVAHAKERRPPERGACRLIAGFHRRMGGPFPKAIDDYETLLTDNRIWKQRTVNIGVVSPERAMHWDSPARCCAVQASPGTSARSNRTRCTRIWTSTSRWA